MRYYQLYTFVILVGCTTATEPSGFVKRSAGVPPNISWETSKKLTDGKPGPADSSTPTPEVVATAAPPAYDLVGDVASRVRQARLDLGERISIQIVKDVFVVVGPQGQVSGAARTAELAIEAYVNGRFTQAPSRAITVYLFPSAKPYQAYCRRHWNAPCISGYGFYGHDERQIVLDVGLGVGTLTHELVHPIFEQDFPKAPIWIEEGIASLYEGFSLPKKGQIRGVKNWRLPRLLDAINSRNEREHARIDNLFGMQDATFRGDGESLNYSLARYFCLWMEQNNLLWDFYHQWKDNYESDTTGEKAFTRVVGQSPSDANQAWQRWLVAI